MRHTDGRYAQMFKACRARNEGAFIPFVMVGDPGCEQSLRVIEALIEGGADALELGIPFSDPIADGPVIQQAAQRALAAGVTPAACFEVIAQVRQRHPDIPVGLLVYANLVVHRGMDAFYERAAQAGVDSVLVADVPTTEAAPFVDVALSHGIDPVLIATPNASRARLEQVGAMGRGYTYVVTRAGVTGTRERLDGDQRRVLADLKEVGAAPPVLGFGISTPEHVRQTLEAGACGAISGSAVVRRLTAHLDDLDAAVGAVRDFVEQMKGGTRREG